MNRLCSFCLILASLLIALSLGVKTTPVRAEVAQGVVFEDANGNGARDPGERGVHSVLVSNGRDIVRTDDSGSYSIPIESGSSVFVIKPRNYNTRIDSLMIPRFWYHHRPAGSPDSQFRFAGIEPTGPLPRSIDFPLVQSPEPDCFQVVVLADPQPYTLQELDLFLHDVVEELVDSDAAFGVSLGDLVGDNLDFFEPLNQIQALVGIPWYNVSGNHDLNFFSSDDSYSLETYHRVYGPSTYAFQYGPVYFVVLDNVIYKGFHGYDEQGKPRFAGYTGGLRDDQLTFIENLLKEIPQRARVVLLMHIPLMGSGAHQVPQTKRLMQILSGHTHTLSLSGHTHFQQHWFLGADEGYTPPPRCDRAVLEHHHANVATASGSWYQGLPDEYGIPHTTMRCGAPNGYSIITFTGNRYLIDFHASRKPASYQMQIHLPDTLQAGLSAEVVVNVFAGSEKSRVEMRVRGHSDCWTPMRHERRRDPFYLAAKELEEAEPEPPAWRLPGAGESAHIWVEDLPRDLPEGVHLVEVRTEDMFGRQFLGKRGIRIVAGSGTDQWGRPSGR